MAGPAIMMVTKVITTRATNIWSVINPAFNAINPNTISCEPRAFIPKPIASDSGFENFPINPPKNPPINFPSIAINNTNAITPPSKFSIKSTLNPIETKNNGAKI